MILIDCRFSVVRLLKKIDYYIKTSSFKKKRLGFI